MPSIVADTGTPPVVVDSSTDEKRKLPKEIVIRVGPTTSVSSLEEQNASGIVFDSDSDGLGSYGSDARIQNDDSSIEIDADIDDNYHHQHQHHDHHPDLSLPVISPNLTLPEKRPKQREQREHREQPPLYNEAKGSVLLRLCPATAGILILSLLCSPRRQYVQYNDYNHYRLIRSLKIIGSAFLACLMYLSLLYEQQSKQQYKQREEQQKQQEQQQREQEQEQSQNPKWSTSLSRLRKVRLLIIYILGWQMLVEIALGNIFTNLKNNRYENLNVFLFLFLELIKTKSTQFRANSPSLLSKIC